VIDTPMLVGGAFLVLTELARSVPAWLRVRRSRSSDGVSPVSIGVLGGTAVAWFAAAVAARSPAAVVATAVWFGLHVLLWRETARVTPAKARTIAVTATASDNIEVSGVQFLLDGAPLGAEDPVAPYSVSWVTSGVADGAHTLSARARDAAGNIGSAAVVNVTVANAPDNVAPAVSIPAPLRRSAS